MQFRLISSRHNPVVLSFHPLQLDIPVIIRGRPPDIVLHGTIQKVLVLINHLRKSAGELIVSVAEIVGRNDEIMVILIHSQCFSCCIAICKQLFHFLISIFGCFDTDLVKSQFKAGRQNFCGFLQKIGQFQEAFSFFCLRYRKGDLFFAMSRKIQDNRIIDNPFFHNNPINGSFVMNAQKILDVCKIHIVVKDCCPFFLIKGPYSHRTMNIFELHEPRVWCAIRINQAVHAEVSVLRILVVISSISIDFFTLDRLSKINRMVTPLPHEAAAGSVIGMDDRKVIFQVSRAVAHSVAVFAHHKGLAAVLFKIIMHLIQ